MGERGEYMISSKSRQTRRHILALPTINVCKYVTLPTTATLPSSSDVCKARLTGRPCNNGQSLAVCVSREGLGGIGLAETWAG